MRRQPSQRCPGTLPCSNYSSSCAGRHRRWAGHGPIPARRSTTTVPRFRTEAQRRAHPRHHAATVPALPGDRRHILLAQGTRWPASATQRDSRSVSPRASLPNILFSPVQQAQDRVRADQLVRSGTQGPGLVTAACSLLRITELPAAGNSQPLLQCPSNLSASTRQPSAPRIFPGIATRCHSPSAHSTSWSFPPSGAGW
jgi:hypothetical protein